jgi:hypothetical protein
LFAEPRNKLEMRGSTGMIVSRTNYDNL